MSKRAQCVLILSEKGSGSTILKNSLLSHRDINCVAFTQHREHETLFWLKAAYMMQLDQEDFLKSRDAMFSYDQAKAQLIELLRKNIPNFALPKTDTAIIFDGWQQLVEIYPPIFLEKTPHHLQNRSALKLILQYMNDSDKDVKIILLIRNPLEMIYSAWSTWHSDMENRQFDWQESYENWLWMKAQLPPDSFYEVNYEEFVQAPKTIVSALCEFIGIDYDDSMSDQIHMGALGHFKTDALFTVQLDKAVIELAQNFGYSAEELQNPVISTDSSLIERYVSSFWQRRKRLQKHVSHRIKRTIKSIVLKARKR